MIRLYFGIGIVHKEDYEKLIYHIVDFCFITYINHYN